MARKTLTGDVRVITTKVGEVTEGFYRGFRLVDTGKEKPQRAHSMEAKDGELFEFWGSAQIDIAVERVKPGTYIWITYEGMKPSRRGNMHSFTIEYDDETGDTSPMPGPGPDEKGFDPDSLPF